MIKSAQRIAGLEEYYFSSKLRQIAQWQSEGREIINLGIGSPDLPPSPSVINALQQAASHPANHAYQSYQGLPALRQAMADFYERIYGIKLSPDNQILPLLGSKEGIMYLSMAYLDPGDIVLVPDPGYPAYASAARMAGATVVSYPLKAQNHYLPDIEAIAEFAQNKSVKLMWVNYPHMPTGASGTEQTFAQLANLAMRNGFIMANDNPYGLLQAGKPLSLLSGLDLNQAPCVELNSLSKSFNMAGWRVGMLCGNAEILKQTLKVKSNVDSGMFKPVQIGAIEALKAEPIWFLTLQQTYATRRLLAAQLFDTLGCTYLPGQQGMFLWAQIPEKWQSGELLVEHLLQEAGVFITPGFIFGSEGEQYVRVSLCSTPQQFEKAKVWVERVK